MISLENPVTIEVKPIRLFASLVYELLILIALWMLVTGIFLGVFGGADSGFKRFILQGLLWIVTGFYFVWQWQKSGQTLPAQTWKFKLVNQQQNLLDVKTASLRYVLANVSLLCFGLGFLWALWDKNGLYWHDRLLKTKFVVV
jgi:uncharacterized RDD family membrane protein YckC